jgi:hypothetical protein
VVKEVKKIEMSEQVKGHVASGGPRRKRHFGRRGDMLL